MSHLRIRLLSLLTVLAALLAFVAAPSAMAGSGHAKRALKGDRNRDGIPDRWERRHHLSLRVNQAKRDQDHDGLKNRAEFLAGTDPRAADTDGDGVKDGQENAGTVKSFDGTTLVVHLFNGTDVTGTVDGNTDVECHAAADSSTATASRARAADEGPSSSGDDPSGDDHGDDQGDGQGDDDQGEDSGCGASALTPGTTIREAELSATGAGAVWRDVELVAPKTP